VSPLLSLIFYETQDAAQRLALAVVGKAGPAPDRETPHAGNLLENVARTYHPLHAVLGSAIDLSTLAEI